MLLMHSPNLLAQRQRCRPQRFAQRNLPIPDPYRSGGVRNSFDLVRRDDVLARVQMQQNSQFGKKGDGDARRLRGVWPRCPSSYPEVAEEADSWVSTVRRARQRRGADRLERYRGSPGERSPALRACLNGPASAPDINDRLLAPARRRPDARVRRGLGMTDHHRASHSSAAGPWQELPSSAVARDVAPAC